MTGNREIRLPSGWKQKLEAEFQQPYMDELRLFLRNEIAAGKQIFPPPNEWFAAFDATDIDKVKVVILGQDPYHGPGQAHGLCFSVKPGVQIPPSLQNIYKEQAADLGIRQPAHGCLKFWAEQGVLLLNATLTVQAASAGSHQGKGWERFTDQVISVLNEGRENLVFMLWGSYAQKKGATIDTNRHCVLKAPHPSPLSAHRGFMGCRHFSQANDYLIAHNIKPVIWQLPD